MFTSVVRLAVRALPTGEDLLRAATRLITGDRREGPAVVRPSATLEALNSLERSKQRQARGPPFFPSRLHSNRTAAAGSVWGPASTPGDATSVTGKARVQTKLS